MTDESSPVTIREARSQDSDALAKFFGSPAISHRHLDWKPPIDWMGNSFFLVAETHDSVSGVIICPPAQNGSAWIRYFGASEWRSPERTWQPLWRKVSQLLQAARVNQVSSLSMNQWFDDLLTGSDFTLRQHIINLEWTDKPLPSRSLPAGISIRTMAYDDLDEVLVVDQQAFEDIWRYSFDELETAFFQSSANTVAVHDGKIIGYQMSTTNSLSGHLARLAVLAAYQKQAIGYNLVSQLLSQLNEMGIWRVSVNTQSTNCASLALYHKMGFVDLEGDIPVYTVHI